jgi:hypothetical protein
MKAAEAYYNMRNAMLMDRVEKTLTPGKLMPQTARPIAKAVLP